MFCFQLFKICLAFLGESVLFFDGPAALHAGTS